MAPLTQVEEGFARCTTFFFLKSTMYNQVHIGGNKMELLIGVTWVTENHLNLL